MSEHAPRFVPGVLAAVLAGLPAPASDVFLASRVEMQAGYENNRLAESGGGEGSAFWGATPGLDLTLFGEKTETSLLFDLRRTQYGADDLEPRDEASVFAQWRYFGGRNEVGAGAGGGLSRGEGLAGEDFAFWQLRPYLVRTLECLPGELRLMGALRRTVYDAPSGSAAADRTDTRADVRPALWWHLSRAASVWVEMLGQRNLSESAEAEYAGLGGATGCTLRPSARAGVGAWTEAVLRDYAASSDGEDRRTTPWRAGAWATYRLRDWLELFAAADWESMASTIEGDDYSWWRVGGGVRLVFESAL